jgi:serine/threonine-protein kinase RsbW
MSPGEQFGRVANMAENDSRTFSKDIEALDDIFAFVDTCLSGSQMDTRTVFSISFAIEEIFTNMVKYNTESANDILVEIETTDRKVVASLTDFQVSQFDVTSFDEVSTDLPLADRKVGGLGLHLVNKFVDNIAYEYENGNSKITLVKELERENV